MKIAILTGHNFNKFAIALAKKSMEARLEFSVIVCTDFKDLSQGILDKIRKKRTFEYIGSHVDESLTGLSKKLGFKVYFSGGVNSKKIHALLKSLSPDIAVQAGVGIIRARTLSMFSEGILNAHMALLPKYRGMNVLEWSLFYKDPIGVTVHFMDEGIDTGDILLKHEISLKEGDTIESLRDRAETVSADLILDVISGAMCCDPVQRIRQDAAEGKLYFVMHPRLKALVRRRLSKG
jgi:hypothetical protein